MEDYAKIAKDFQIQQHSKYQNIKQKIKIAQNFIPKAIKQVKSKDVVIFCFLCYSCEECYWNLCASFFPGACFPDRLTAITCFQSPTWVPSTHSLVCVCVPRGFQDKAAARALGKARNNAPFEVFSPPVLAQLPLLVVELQFVTVTSQNLSICLLFPIYPQTTGRRNKQHTDFKWKI